MTPTLVVMAAGLGSRFGGVKQLAPVGPGGEVILDYTIRDAMAAGLEQVVLIVRSDIRADVEEHVSAIHGAAAPITYVHQDELPPPRPEKPWGTVHATLSAAPAINGPFVLVNADDYYGTRSFAIAAAELGHADEHTCSIVAFELAKTLSASGSVTRGVCQVADGRLTGIAETGDLQRRPDGTVGIGPDGPELAPDTPVSMNLWAFHPSILAVLRDRFDAWLALNRDVPKAECLLPTEIGHLKDEGRLVVRVVSSPETWTGITNPDDLDAVRTMIADVRAGTH
jgi:NDP-sugar pyrophosphorylase family protein